MIYCKVPKSYHEVVYDRWIIKSNLLKRVHVFLLLDISEIMPLNTVIFLRQFLEFYSLILG